MQTLMSALSTTVTALKMQFASTRSAATSATANSATQAMRIITAMVLSVSLTISLVFSLFEIAHL